MSEAHVIDDVTVRGGAAAANRPADLLIEIPHGATATGDFTALAAELESPLPDGLVDFFHVNTDTGAPELGAVVATEFLSRSPERVVRILRSRIPRTFIDCNRRLDATLAEYKAGGVAPGIMPWVTSAADKTLLVTRYSAYIERVRAARAELAADGAMLLLHTYAPRTVGVEVDLQIVKSLHHAYAPERVGTWPLRPEVDVIAKAGEVSFAPPGFVTALTAAYAPLGFQVGESATYPLHDSTVGWEHIMAMPGRAVCVELRRDLFVAEFMPFAEAAIDPARVAALAGPLVTALATLYSAP